MEKIGIFCSASNRLPSVYVETTRQLGEWLGKEKKTIIYGGANLGLMEDIASAAKANGATLIGVVPKILCFVMLNQKKDAHPAIIERIAPKAFALCQ